MEGLGWRWAELVAAAFGAGRPTAALARVDAGILNVVAEHWWWDTYRAAARIEQAASADGVSMPDRLPPLVAVLDLDGARQHWQLHRWCDGHNPTEARGDLAGREQAATECLARLRGVAKSLHHIPERAGWRTEVR